MLPALPRAFPCFSSRGAAALSFLACTLACTAFLVAALAARPHPARAQAAEGEIILQDLKVVEEGDRRVVEITVKDILRLALQRSNPLKVAKIGEEIARSRLAAAHGRNNPTLENKFEVGRFISPFSSTFSGDNFLRLSRSDETVLSSQLSKKVDSGITYGLTFREERSASETLLIVSEGDSPSLDTTTTSRTISQSSLTGSVNIPIYQDYGRELDEVPVRQGEIGIRQSRLETRRDTLTVLGGVAAIYWDLVNLRAQVKVAEESVKLSERLVDDNQRRVEAGVLSPADVAVAESQLARERQNLLEFQSAALRIEDQVRAALNLEAVQLGYRPIEEPTVRETNFEYEKLAKKMFRNSPQLAILKTSLESNRYDLLQARNQDKTDLDLDLFYVFNGFDSSALGGVSGFSETDLGGYGASLTWTVPLFDHATKEEIRQKVLERSRIELLVRDERSNLSVQLQSVLRNLRLTRREVETARIAQSLAEQLLKNEIERFRLGRSTSFRVAEFQQDASAAQRREIAARVRFEKTFLDMLVLTGDIFEFYGLPDDS